MLLSISNIAWSKEYDEEMYVYLRDNGWNGLEIAPTRIFPERPYDHIDDAYQFAAKLRNEYGLAISSIQSIWYGRDENIFESSDERMVLIEYTKKAIEFSAAVGCKNLVFGCPKNRNIPGEISCFEQIAMDFFSRIAEYAAANGTVIALEPNPLLYGTNFINTTEQAVGFCRKLNIAGLKVNIDVGTMIANEETFSVVTDNLDIINHIHISEPKLVPIKRRDIHSKILALPFDRYVSIEMGNCIDIDIVREVAEYVTNLEVNH